jgi:hypothetical protein
MNANGDREHFSVGFVKRRRLLLFAFLKTLFFSFVM